MNGSVGWPDVVIVTVLAIATIKGFARGFLAELRGAAAVLSAFAAGLYYNGVFDAALEETFKMNLGSADITGRIVSAVIVYVTVMLLFSLLSRYAKLPALGAGNAVGGGVVGFVKGAILLWVALFVSLLFPLSGQVRSDLHKSRLVGILVQQSERVDAAIYGKMPDVAKPFVKPILDREQV